MAIWLVGVTVVLLAATVLTLIHADSPGPDPWQLTVGWRTAVGLAFVLLASIAYAVVRGRWRK